MSGNDDGKKSSGVTNSGTAVSSAAGSGGASTGGSGGNASNEAANLLYQSKDAQTMIAVLKEMGIDEFEPRVVSQLLEFSYRYTTNLLEDARAFSQHANKKTIDSEDIKMAIKSRVDFSFTATPPRDLLLEISKSKNKNPLPLIKYHSGIRLPPDRFCLHAPNYTVKTQTHHSHQQAQMQQEQPNIAASKQQQQPVMTAASMSFGSISIKRPRNDEDDYDI